MGQEKNVLKGEYRKLFTMFSESEHGQSLDGQPRWDKYRPEHISKAEWITLLGRDADNLQHMWLTQGITELFINADDGSLDLSDEDTDILRTSAVMHDWGESFDIVTGVGGDINYELKTVDDTTIEQQKFEHLYDQLIGNSDIKRKYMIISTIFNHDSRLGRIFNSIERIGYMHTAQRAYQLSKDESDPILADHLRWLTAGVLSNQTVALMEYAASYAPVRQCIEANTSFLDEAFTQLNSNLFITYKQSHERIDRFNQAKTAWQHGLFGADPHEQKTDTNVFSDNPNYDTRFIEEYRVLKQKIEACRELGLKVVLTSGSFDLMHVGHMRYIEKASQHGDVLVVGVDSDTKIRERKGPDRPIIDERERAQMISHIRGVTYITLKQPSAIKWELIKAVRPDVLIATAETYTPQEVKELEENYCHKVVVLEPQATTSTSARLREMNIKRSRKVIDIVRRRLENGITDDLLWENLDDEG